MQVIAKETYAMEPNGGAMGVVAGGAAAADSVVVGRVDTTMANSVSRPATPPPPIDMFCPMAENWCYTQV
jgi:hypothetical protein